MDLNVMDRPHHCISY